MAVLKVLHLDDEWDRPTAVTNGENVEELIASPGWDALLEAIESRLRAEQRALMVSKPKGDDATYERIIGQWNGLAEVKAVAEAIVENGKDKARELRETD